MPPRRISHTHRFLSHIGASDERGCWPWKSTFDVYGYAIFSIRQHPFKAHRYAYEYFVGAIPEGLTIDHLCRNKGCVNPTHMEPVPFGVNTLRGDAWSGQNSRKDACPLGHAYDMAYADGRRGCRKCNRNKTARFRAKRLGGASWQMEMLASSCRCRRRGTA